MLGKGQPTPSYRSCCGCDGGTLAQWLYVDRRRGHDHSEHSVQHHRAGRFTHPATLTEQLKEAATTEALLRAHAHKSPESRCYLPTTHRRANKASHPRPKQNPNLFFKSVDRRCNHHQSADHHLEKKVGNPRAEYKQSITMYRFVPICTFATFASAVKAQDT